MDNPQQNKPEQNNCAGLILAGGQSRRMGQNKALIALDGQTLLERAIERLRPQVQELAINAPQDALQQHDTAVLENFSLVPDLKTGFLGPLAGVHAGMSYFAQRGFSYMVTVSVDAPFFPTDLVQRLCAAEQNYVCAQSNERAHPVFALWPCAAHEALGLALEQGLRRVDEWTKPRGLVQVSWPDQPYDPFFNINRPQDLEQAISIQAF